MNGTRLEWLAVLLSISGLVLHQLAWAPPPRIDRATYVEILTEAGRAGESPRAVARQRGYLDMELGRAAWHYGDLASERAIAAGLRPEGDSGR